MLLTHLINFFSAHGYAAVLVALLICSFGIPLPEDITLVAGGVIAGLGLANVWGMVIVALFGVLVGDAIMFSLGNHFGDRVLHWRPLKRLINRERYEMIQQKFDEYGNRVLFTSRFLPGARAAVYITAGATHRISLWRFLLFDGLAAIISVPIWVFLGYFGANNEEWLMKWIHRGQAGIWILVVIAAVAIAIFWWRRRQRKKDSHSLGNL